MEIKYIDTAELKPYENNPRFNANAVDAVARSIEEFGFKNPIIIDKDYCIIAGHTRLTAANKLGIKKVPCIIADDLSEDKARAFRIADNKTAELSQWDFEALQEEIDALFEAGFDMADFGFDKALEFDFDDVEDLSDETYEEPSHRMLECPKCGHIDRDIHFKKVDEE